MSFNYSVFRYRSLQPSLRTTASRSIASLLVFAFDPNKTSLVTNRQGSLALTLAGDCAEFSEEGNNLLGSMRCWRKEKNKGSILQVSSSKVWSVRESPGSKSGLCDNVRQCHSCTLNQNHTVIEGQQPTTILSK